MRRALGVLGWLLAVGGLGWAVSGVATAGEDVPGWLDAGVGAPAGIAVVFVGGGLIWLDRRLADERRLRAGARPGTVTLTQVEVHRDPYVTYAFEPVTCLLEARLSNGNRIVGRYRASVGSGIELLVDGATFPCAVDPEYRRLVRVYPWAGSTGRHIDFHDERHPARKA